MKYGLYYTKDTADMGDDLRAYAQSLFYPHIDYKIDSKTVYKFESSASEKVASIFCGLIAPHNYEYAFCPSEQIIPLFIGSYFPSAMFDFLDTSFMRAYLSEYAPVGCRTNELADLFKERGIPAYFSGCITLTLPNLHGEKNDYVCLVDVPDQVSEMIHGKIGSKFDLKYVSHCVDEKTYSEKPLKERFDLVQQTIELYAGAHCVVTSRLDAALVCLTQNTPVFVIEEDSAEWEDRKETGMRDYLTLFHHNECKEVMNGNVSYDFLNPPDNPNLYHPYRENLTESCKSFVRECECGNDHSGISSQLSAERKTVIDILQKKITRLKDTVDRKNNHISTLKKGVLSAQRKLRKYETFNEWEGIENFSDWWEERSFIMSKYIMPECKSLLDLGCGKMHIRRFINDQIKYYGCDYKKRDEETIVCDLAKGEFPSIHVDTIFMAGVLEYLSNYHEVLKKCSSHCTQFLLGYSTLEALPRGADVHVNHLGRQELIDEMLQNGFELVNTDRFRINEIFNFKRING